MDGRLRAVGEVEHIVLGDLVSEPALKSTMIGLIHRGATEANIWARKTQAVQLTEARAIAELFKTEDLEVLEIAYGPARDSLESIRLAIIEEHEKKGEAVPARYDSPITLRQVIKAPDDDWRQLQRDAVKANLKYATGPSFEGEDLDSHVAEIERLGCLLAVYKEAMAVQRLSAESFPTAEGAGSDGPGVDSESVE
jgi:hypothetical protein